MTTDQGPNINVSQSPSSKSAALFQEALNAEARQDYFEALSKYTASLSLDGNQVPTWVRIGKIFLRTMKYQQARETMEFVLGMDPHNVDAIYGLAISYFYLGKLEEARAFIDQAVEMQPDNATYAIDRANIYSISQPDPERKRQLYQAWGQCFADPLARQSPPLLNNRNPDRVLKVGYVSGDMRDHAIAFFMEPVFRHHDPSQVEVHVFSTAMQEDDTTAHLKSLVPHWHDVSRLDDDALFKLIRSQQMDVLVDLSGHTYGHRLYVFARRAAPVQVTWLGYMGGTLGMQAMDYRLTDYSTDPIGHEAYYLEKLYRLECMASYIPPAHAPLVETPPMLQGNPPTIGCLNSSRKVTDRMLLLWKRIMEQRTDIQLLLQVQENSIDDAIHTIEPRLVELDMQLDRIIISPMVPLEEFMERGALVDVALDTSPVSGGTTTLHTLWMGLPLATLDAEEAVSSTTARTLAGLGYGEWVATSEEEYISTVLTLLENPQVLVDFRRQIRSRMQACRLMDYKGRCIELEKAYRRMWFNHLLGEDVFLDYQPFTADQKTKVTALREKFHRE
ncbi:O-linked N-acetylglucosamine transferase, SPINDLY family protein [Methylovorus glucosotrophus]|uniref:protein O-GlcNAc transferase n=1 Tax=Methylovorus glucosotrophus (strain SIP3-4) TaxID=582744 RepID=C6XBQ1_METGS|nr:tetratricopeptide repeat protein [Methylovorus glucosotrophus]ACT52021.1 TPR repeat-containing protein [Methylovorus glucosotrophus SIP3-4]